MSARLEKFILEHNEEIKKRSTNFYTELFSTIWEQIEHCSSEIGKIVNIKVYSRYGNPIDDVVLEDIVDFCHKKNILFKYSKWAVELDENRYVVFAGYNCRVHMLF